MKKIILPVLLALLIVMSAGSAAHATELVSLKASFPAIGEYDCKTPHSPPVTKEFTIPGPGSLVYKLWVKPHVDAAYHGPFWMTKGSEPLFRYLERTGELLTVDGQKGKGRTNGRPYYYEVQYRVKGEAPLTGCKAIISPPQRNCEQWKQVVELSIEFYPAGTAVPPPGANAPDQAEKAATDTPETADGRAAAGEQLYEQGLQAIRAKDFAQAVDLLTKAVDSGAVKGKKLANAYYQRSWALGKLGKTALAMRDVDRAIQVDPDNSVYHHMRAWWLMKNRDYQDALRECEIAIRLDPKNPFAYHTLSRTQEEMGNCAEALVNAQKALQLLPTDVNLRNNLARLKEKCGGS